MYPRPKLFPPQTCAALIDPREPYKLTSGTWTAEFSFPGKMACDCAQSSLGLRSQDVKATIAVLSFILSSAAKHKYRQRVSVKVSCSSWDCAKLVPLLFCHIPPELEDLTLEMNPGEASPALDRGVKCLAFLNEPGLSLKE
ncbi:hypothetical protein RLOC_00005194 [Lonchura striata]|uniref:Uncharacterized protein n=1 Tax=Lonchura striata TaxID=40157 RepID=A0A218UHM3_9PASE|nr:hypothetical protein RLOC_00005194 [Lonchura striata domestica]